MKKVYTILSLVLAANFAMAQTPTLPQPYSLASGNYLFDRWGPNETPGTYPPNMVFHFTTSSEFPGYDHTAEGARDYDCAYDKSIGRNHIQGLLDSGIAFFATSGAAYNNCIGGTDKTADANRYVGDAVLAVSTLGKTGVQVKFTGKIIQVGDGNGDPTKSRDATVRLQYRVGATGNYTDVVDGNDTIEVKTTGREAGSLIIRGTTLPSVCDNQSLVYLRWVYFSISASGAAGTRPTLSLDDISVGSNVLPVNLLSFGVANVNGAAGLSWQTANEVNFSRFDVQRSLNNGSYATIATVTAKGNGGNTYSLTDKGAAAGTNQYRLKLVNTDGSFAYSSVVTFTVGAKGDLKVTPNPVIDRFTLTHPAALTGATVSVYSYDGRKVATYPVAAGAVQTPVNASALVKGNYLVVFTSGSQKLVAKMTKN